MILNIIDLKKTNYAKALEIQQSLQQKRINDEISDSFIVVEHPPVLTMGKRGKQDSILAPKEILDREGIETVWINRGGDATYHGPGQIVGYPIIHLAQNNLGIRVFVEKIQETIINFLKNEFDIDANKKSGVHTGVWVGEKKICAIGIAVSRNVTMHGFAFNVNTDLKHFEYINPCGLGAGKVTSLKKILGHHVDFDQAKKQVATSFCQVFNAQPEHINIKNLIGEL